MSDELDALRRDLLIGVTGFIAVVWMTALHADHEDPVAP